MFVILAILLFSIAPIGIVLLQRTEYEGRSWLVLLSTSFVGLTLIILSPLQVDNLFERLTLFASTNLFIAPRFSWEYAEWIVMITVSLLLSATILVDYQARSTHTFSKRRYGLFYYSVGLCIFILIIKDITLLSLMLFLIDVLYFFYLFSYHRESLIQRPQIISLIVKLTSFVFLQMLSSVFPVQTVNNDVLTLIVLMIFLDLRLLSLFLDVTKDFQRSTFGNVYSILLGVFLLSISSKVLPIEGLAIAWQIGMQVLIGIVFLFILVRTIRSRKEGLSLFEMIALSTQLGLLSLLNGTGISIVHFILPVIFRILNNVTSDNSLRSRRLQIGLQGILLSGLFYTPFHTLNRSLIEAQALKYWVSLVILLLEGLYFSVYIAGELRSIAKDEGQGSRKRSEFEYAFFLFAIGSALIIGRTVLDPLSTPIFQIQPFLPLIVSLIGILLLYRGKFQQIEDLEQQSSIGFSPLDEVLNVITRIFVAVNRVIRELYLSINSLLEGEGGLIWALIFLVLLLTVYRGLL